MKTLIAAAEPDPPRWSGPGDTPTTNTTVIVSSFEDYPTTATTVAWTTEILEPWAVAEW